MKLAFLLIIALVSCKDSYTIERSGIRRSLVGDGLEEFREKEIIKAASDSIAYMDGYTGFKSAQWVESKFNTMSKSKSFRVLNESGDDIKFNLQPSTIANIESKVDEAVEKMAADQKQ